MFIRGGLSQQWDSTSTDFVRMVIDRMSWSGISKLDFTVPSPQRGYIIL